MRNLVGLFAPLPTPFTDDTSSVSEVRLARLIRHFTDEGVQGFVIGAECGEFTTLSHAERKTLVEYASRMVGGRPFIVHITCFATTPTLDLAQHAARMGAQFLVLSPPPYGEHTDDEVHQFLSFVAHHAELPVVVTDPQRRLNAAIRDRLAVLPTLQLARPVSGNASFYPEGIYSDQFSLEECCASPMVTIAPWRLYPEALIEWLPEPLRKAGSARVLKAALEIQGLECGPLRGPAQRLDAPLRELLSEYLVHSDAA